MWCDAGCSNNDILFACAGCGLDWLDYDITKASAKAVMVYTVHKMIKSRTRHSDGPCLVNCCSGLVWYIVDTCVVHGGVPLVWYIAGLLLCGISTTLVWYIAGY